MNNINSNDKISNNEPQKIDKRGLSTTMSYALRHNPKEFGLILDEEGFTPIIDLLNGIKNHSRKYENITITDIEEAANGFKKKRYEIRVDRIRAYYGHSIPEKIKKTPITPPEILYHGTSKEASLTIMSDKLRHMGRQYVCLSADIPTAEEVARRKGKDIVILKIKAKEASEDGILFYKEPNNVYESEDIPNKYIYI